MLNISDSVSCIITMHVQGRLYFYIYSNIRVLIGFMYMYGKRRQANTLNTGNSVLMRPLLVQSSIYLDKLACGSPEIMIVNVRSFL